MAFSPKIVHLPGTKLSPEVVLHRTLTKLGSIKAIAIVIQWNDDSFNTDWSSMKTSELVMAGKVLDHQATCTAMGYTRLEDTRSGEDDADKD